MLTVFETMDFCQHSWKLSLVAKHIFTVMSYLQCHFVITGKPSHFFCTSKIQGPLCNVGPSTGERGVSLFEILLKVDLTYQPVRLSCCTKSIIKSKVAVCVHLMDMPRYFNLFLLFAVSFLSFWALHWKVIISVLFNKDAVVWHHYCSHVEALTGNVM